MTTHRPKAKAFSLVELLVVIGIIVLLIALLLPVLRGARQAADGVRCLSNLRQISQALEMYSASNGGYLVPGDYWGSQDDWPGVSALGKRGRGSWASILLQGKYTHGNIEDDDDEDGDGDSIFRCPSGLENAFSGMFERPASQTDARGALSTARLDDFTNQSIRTWYAINCTPGVPLGYLPFRMLPEFGDRGFDYRLTRLSQFRNSSRLPLVFDGLWMWMDLEPACINARHKNRTVTNVLFADGHAEAQLTRTLPNADWIASPGSASSP